MPRRNFRWLIAISVISGICYLYVPGSRYSRVLAESLDLVARRYYRPVNELELFENAMKGMAPDRELREVLKTPLDEHSHYISPADKPQFDNDLNQEFIGIGILQVQDPKTKQLLVLSPVPDGPAVAAGVRAGDRIVKIDGQSTQGMSLEDAKARIKGRAGTSVTITVQHPGAAHADDMTIVRRTVHEDTVEGASRGPDGRWNFLLPGKSRVGYVWIRGFTDADGGDKSTVADFRAALEQLRKDKVRGLVLDLRDNGGGSLRAAVEICDMLVPSGEIVTTRGREQRVLRAYVASGRARFTDFPIAVLVNGYSASASEIVAACLQDNGRAIVAGQRSYGKGTVQEVIDLGPALGEMKFTVATYWRPSGQDINRPKEDGENIPWGVTPNEGFDVPVTDRQRQKLLENQQDREIAALTGAKTPPEVPDLVLQKAVEHLGTSAR
jgi:carboxyl-terminal processing protease